MATLGTGAGNLLDVSSLFGADGKELRVAEVLNQVNDIVQDMPMVEGTDSDGLQAAMRSGLPSVTWPRFNEGVQPSKGTLVNVKFATGTMSTVSNVDCRLAKKYSDPEAYRASQDKAHIEALGQEMARAVFYESETTNPGRFTGLSSYFNSLSAENADQIIDAAGTGSDNTSIWVVCWSPEAVTGIYPKGSKAGLEVRNMGEQLVVDSTGINGSTYLGYQTRFLWDVGLAVQDWRQVVRICNIDHSNLVTNSSAADLPKLLSRAVDMINNPGAGKMCIYSRRDVAAVLNEQALARVSNGGGVSYENVDGKVVKMWRGIPLRRCDALTKTEARIT